MAAILSASALKTGRLDGKNVSIVLKSSVLAGDINRYILI
jgi:hypothetical protein